MLKGRYLLLFVGLLLLEVAPQVAAKTQSEFEFKKTPPHWINHPLFPLIMLNIDQSVLLVPHFAGIKGRHLAQAPAPAVALNAAQEAAQAAQQANQAAAIPPAPEGAQPPIAPTPGPQRSFTFLSPTAQFSIIA